MNRYFAYGSNMSRARLEARLGLVIHHGYAVLAGYEHRFSHRGRDGSAKGNILVATQQEVHGVLYELSDEQVETLNPYEGGYDIIHVSVRSFSLGEDFSAYTYMDSRPPCGLLPRADYLEHYLCGMRENDLPRSYIEAILEQAKR